MKRRIFNGDDMSLCFWRIKQGLGPTPYDGHPANEQFGLIIAGQLDFRIGSDERVTLGPGDVYWEPKDQPHGDSHLLGDPPTKAEGWNLAQHNPARAALRHGYRADGIVWC